MRWREREGEELRGRECEGKRGGWKMNREDD